MTYGGYAPAMQVDQLERSQRACSHLVDEGYVVLPHFLDSPLIAAVRGEVDVLLDAPPVAGCERPHNRLVPLRWNDKVVNLVLEGPERRRRLAASSGGGDLRWISGYISAKEPHTPALWWHQDWWCWSHAVSFRRAAAQVALLCYLSDTSRDSGALRVLPGSHHGSLPLHALLPEAHAEGQQLPLDHDALRDQRQQVTLSLRAGDAVVLDYRLLHGTHPNAADQRRDCVLLSFTPSWDGLPPEIRAHLIQHTAQPSEEERCAVHPWISELLPTFAGARADLELDRAAPARFAAHG
jgi:hypothetical protein